MKSTLEQQLHVIHGLMQRKQFSEAIKVARATIRRFPDEPLLHTVIATCQMAKGRISYAMRQLRRAESMMPQNHIIESGIAGIYEVIEVFDMAGDYYSRALSHTPPDLHDTLSDYMNSLGACLWHTGLRDEALDMWQKALNEDLGNKNAKENLEKFKNEYNEPRRHGPFNDLWHFEKIQIERYFEATGKEEFDSKVEAEMVLGTIMQAWNDNVAPLLKKLDSMTTAAKTELFRAIEVDHTRQLQRKIGRGKQSRR